MNTGKRFVRLGWTTLAGRLGILAGLALLIVAVRTPLGSAGKPAAAPALSTSSGPATVPPGLVQNTSPNASPAADEHARSSKAVAYKNEKVPEGPWSIHVIKFDLHNPDYEFHTTLANGTVQGMTPLTEQIKAFPPALGRPIAAINGDFYKMDSKPYIGDPQGLQLLNGEVVSGPVDNACFWIDLAGKPHAEVVQPLFRVSWPDGSGLPFGLNEERHPDTAVLYTPTMGPSTGTKPGGREIVLEAFETNAFLPLQLGLKLTARIKEIHDAGDSPLRPGIVILSLGPNLLVDAPTVKPGDLIQLLTKTTPDLTGCRTAIGGSPRLVIDGKSTGPWSSWRSGSVRHPRTAIGWNDDAFYFVLVDGRQPGLSVGMTFQELAAYFIKLGCTTALNLDGGGSASMWAFGQTVSSPSEGQERPIANGLLLVKKPKR